MPSPFDGGVVLITGASSGIGREIARLIAGRARAIALVARRKDRLDELKAELLKQNPSLRVVVHACDITKQGDREAMVAAIEAEAGPVDVLVNNAGFGDLGVFDRLTWDKTERMIALNVTALTHLTHRVLQGMVERGRGGILNVSSGWGMTFGPGLTTYIATKHFVTAFTEGLRLDLAGTGVRVTQICPGPVATEFNDTLGNFTGMAAPGLVEISAERCARAAVRALDRNRALVVPGVLIWIVLHLGVLTPRWILRLFYRPVARLLRKKHLSLPAPSPEGERA